MIPESLIAPIKMVDGTLKQLNMSGKYRPCEEQGCGKYITCPYVRCKEHWYGLIFIEQTDMKEWKDEGVR